MNLQNVVATLAKIVTRYEETEMWNKDPDRPYPKITTISKDEIEAVRGAINLLMGETP